MSNFADNANEWHKCNSLYGIPSNSLTFNEFMVANESKIRHLHESGYGPMGMSFLEHCHYEYKNYTGSMSYKPIPPWGRNSELSSFPGESKPMSIVSVEENEYRSLKHIADNQSAMMRDVEHRLFDKNRQINELKEKLKKEIEGNQLSDDEWVKSIKDFKIIKLLTLKKLLKR